MRLFRFFATCLKKNQDTVSGTTRSLLAPNVKWANQFIAIRSIQFVKWIPCPPPTNAEVFYTVNCWRLDDKNELVDRHNWIVDAVCYVNKSTFWNHENGSFHLPERKTFISPFIKLKTHQNRLWHSFCRKDSDLKVYLCTLFTQLNKIYNVYKRPIKFTRWNTKIQFSNLKFCCIFLKLW